MGCITTAAALLVRRMLPFGFTASQRVRCVGDCGSWAGADDENRRITDSASAAAAATAEVDTTARHSHHVRRPPPLQRRLLLPGVRWWWLLSANIVIDLADTYVCQRTFGAQTLPQYSRYLHQCLILYIGVASYHLWGTAGHMLPQLRAVIFSAHF